VSGLAVRGLKFYTVGGLGIGVQLVALALFKSVLGWPYLIATAAAVEVVVIHNFLWHDRWTWKEREGGWRAFVRFNLTTGLLSIAANVVLMRVLAGWLGIHYLAANLIAIATASLLNFVASEFFVFRRQGGVRATHRAG